MIDVGSTALRLAVGEHTPNGQLNRLETLEAPVAIGRDTLAHGRIRAVTAEEAVRTFRDFFVVLQGYGITPAQCRAVATTAVRDARNREVFLDRVHQVCGLRIEVIEAIDELRLNYQLVRRTQGPAFDRGTRMLLSMGAGGTQIVIQNGGAIVFEETLHFGMLKLLELSEGRWPEVLPTKAFLAKVVRSVGRVQDLRGVTGLVVICSEVHQLVTQLDSALARRAGLTMRLAELKAFDDRVAAMSKDDLVRGTTLDHDKVEKGVVALAQLRAFADATSARQIVIPSVSMLDSLLLDTALMGEDAAGEDLEQLVHGAAAALGRKYRHDEAHGQQVCRLALQLFDGLSTLVALAPRSRLLLAAAAILHDVGYFISPRGHERHSHYLISSGEVMGLSKREQRLVALVALYHRQVQAFSHDPRLDALRPEEVVELLKLAALLRLAEALDQDHQQRVARVSCRLEPERLRVLAETRYADREEFAVISDAFARKADLFEEVFGIRPTLREVLAG